MFFGGMLLSYILVMPRVYDSPEQADFSSFYTAGKIVQRGLSSHLYDWDLQTQVQSEFSRASALRHRALPYLRPPFEAILFVPFSYLPYRQAFAAWIVLSLVLVGGTATLLHRRILELAAIPRWIYYPAVFSYCPFAHGLALGQDFAVLFLLVALTIIFLYCGSDFYAGCFLALGLIKFQLVLPIVLVLAIKKRFRTLAGFSVVAVLLLGFGVWLVGLSEAVSYPAYLWRLNQDPAAAGIFPSMMPSARGLVQGWGAMQSSRAMDLSIGLISLVLLGWTARQWRTDAPRQSRAYLAGIAAVLLATQLTGYHASGYDMSLLFPVVLAAAAAGLHDGELDAITRWVLLSSAILILLAPLYLLLLGLAHAHLLAVPVILLLWGYSRASRTWSFGLARAAHSA